MKKHQHFIPRTYLKYFKNSPDSELINAFNKENNVYKDIGLKDVCVEKNFYTLKHLKGEDSLVIEEYFDKEIERKFDKIYNLLITQKLRTVDIEQKLDILKVTLSMYFRTPKKLNEFISNTDKLIDEWLNDQDIQDVNFFGFKINLQGKTKKNIQNELREHLRPNYLSIQLQLFEDFVNFKINDGLTVIENTGEYDFFTGDNPVNLLNKNDISTDLYNVENSIYIPLNPKFYLFIAPPKLEKSGSDIFYQKDNFLLSHMVNACTFENSEKWILGKGVSLKKSLEKYFELDNNYDPNHPILDDMKIKIVLMTNVLEASKKGFSTANLELVNSLKELKNWNKFSEHIDLIELVNTFKKYGIII
ncbi:DUF4238 domain-containing protein [Chryseobacterium sp. S0630]|uniref:DUF4238 domain-containing protein n=1 Tax=Chryseobacterium sp. S0630 TaxID=2957803 RepID=UPI00209E39A6|nr:DUF4238 domain-containing protein [Chryseobacterium sp. S0630]MCP1301262.1 DUF4238 domain-containing protein [Chryseobacterium sp. S0630]